MRQRVELFEMQDMHDVFDIKLFSLHNSGPRTPFTEESYFIPQNLEIRCKFLGKYTIDPTPHPISLTHTLITHSHTSWEQELGKYLGYSRVSCLTQNTIFTTFPDPMICILTNPTEDPIVERADPRGDAAALLEHLQEHHIVHAHAVGHTTRQEVADKHRHHQHC